MHTPQSSRFFRFCVCVCFFLHFFPLSVFYSVSSIESMSMNLPRNGTKIKIHSILGNKLRNLTVPSRIINMTIDFLSNLSQKIKLAKGCFSEWGPVPTAVRQGTKLSPWLFVSMINDLDVNTPHVWKFVDDTTAYEVTPKGNTSNAQSIVNQVIKWSRANTESNSTLTNVRSSESRLPEIQLNLIHKLLTEKKS